MLILLEQNTQLLSIAVLLHFTALASLKLKKGDEVIVPAISFVSSATSILHQGCTPIFCDVDMQNYCMCPESLEKSITKTKAIIPVHFAGSTCQMEK